MNTTKISYAAPQLTVHGTVAELTRKGGVAFQDVPQGTPAAPIGPTVDGSHP
jgi:hypothetical protein